ncbi:MAG: RnfABCDGE type electron transport complex subunit B [Betaproteobacteria bacterium]|nr:RnfABCDGE type electron transport complex subunit B [Betaproteobacteria bacterium]NBO44389.1 RnfABCDGE type electron transport complex subunit B [Betaproteobacteria bacterium]NBP11275.1 RnfABCDGE type electron transport complex subunit B [Betaproteobacteria bacterium]NBP61078.1 RnfABCDGE type electron transport complex subunit B [Betaproteobacteria bacterium]NBT63979.1 RnfABCDGE type electron transport complex subunit B [Betaproteobacteria bacterium]
MRPIRKGLTLPSPRLVESIHQLLPQTQCRRCGYPACKPYAQAIAAGEADINRCPPGGEQGIKALAAITGKTAKPLDPSCGELRPLHFAWIVAHDCIGCTKCMLACPVDAIVGGPQRLHAVIPERCTGCELCLPPCPVDCIEMRPWEPERSWTRSDAQEAGVRFEQRSLRLSGQLEGGDMGGDMCGDRGSDVESGRVGARGGDVESDSVGDPVGGAASGAPKTETKAASPARDAASLPRARAIIEAAIARAKARQEGAA